VSELTPAGRTATPDPASWIKSSLSFANSNCVEVASLPGGHVGVRDSKNSQGPVLRFTPGEWHAFVGGVRNGEFDSFGSLWSLLTGSGNSTLQLTVVKTPGEGLSRSCERPSLLGGEAGGAGPDPQPRPVPGAGRQSRIRTLVSAWRNTWS
jgi:Domain of unknown function (DUF397)